MKTTNLKNIPELGYATKEAMNTLFTNISFAGENISKVLITSVHPNDGKSFVAFNLARTIAEMGNQLSNVTALNLTYQSVEDGEITLSDEDYQNYYKKHKAEFRVREELRELDSSLQQANWMTDLL